MNNEFKRSEIPSHSHSTSETQSQPESIVPAEYLAKAKAYVDFLSKDSWSGGLNAEVPYDDTMAAFARGETEYAIEKAEKNLIQNPLQLVRPAQFLSVDQYGEAKKLYQFDRPSSFQGKEVDYFKKIKYNEILRNYKKHARDFARLFVAVLESLAVDDRQDRQALVKAVFESQFSPALGLTTEHLTAADNPAEWLLYQVVSIVSSPDPKLGFLARFRALELLSLFTTEELKEGLEGTDRDGKYFHGLNRVLRVRLPHSLESIEQRDLKLDKEYYQKALSYKSPAYNQVIIKDEANRRVYRDQTINRILQNYPGEAIQLALLFLHDRSTSSVGLSILRNTPDADPALLAKVFGPEATFLTSHKISYNLDAKARRAMGIEGLPAESESKNNGELVAENRRLKMMVEMMEMQKAQDALKLSETLWKNDRLTAENQHLRQVISYWENGTAAPRQSTARPETNGPSARDPKGYYQVLGLHPGIVIGRSDEEVQVVIGAVYKALAKRHHPDMGGTHEKMKEINEAYEVLIDSDKRRRYSGV